MRKYLIAVVLFFLGCTRIEQPSLVSPIGGEVIYSTNPTFCWMPAASARSYNVQISTDPDFRESIDTTVFADTFFSYVADTLESGTLYYWRVSAGNLQGDQGEPSQPETFFIEEAISVTSPLPEDSSWAPVFSWEPFSGADSYILTIFRSYDLGDIWFACTLSENTYVTQDSIPPGTYYWIVQAWSSNQEASTPSRIQRLVSYKLADTYFPLSPDRIQQFEIKRDSGRYYFDSGYIWDTVKSSTSDITIEVTGYYTEEGVQYYILSDTFSDIGDTVGFRNDSIFSPIYFLDLLYPDGPDSFRTWDDVGLSVSLLSDTLELRRQFATPFSGFHDVLTVCRLPGKGVVEQTYYRESFVDSNTRSWDRTILHPKP